MKERQGPPRSVQKHNLNSSQSQYDDIFLNLARKMWTLTFFKDRLVPVLQSDSDCRHMMQLFSSCYQVKISKISDKGEVFTLDKSEFLSRL